MMQKQGEEQKRNVRTHCEMSVYIQKTLWGEGQLTEQQLQWRRGWDSDQS